MTCRICGQPIEAGTLGLPYRHTTTRPRGVTPHYARGQRAGDDAPPRRLRGASVRHPNRRSRRLTQRFRPTGLGPAA